MNEASAPRTNTTLLVVFMWGAYFLNYCDRQAVFAMFPALKAGLGLTDTQLGATGSIFLWVYGIGNPIAGWIADRYSKRILVIASLIVWSFATIGTGFVTSAVMLLLLRAAMGISESMFMPAAIALTAGAHAPTQRSRAIAALSTAQIVGTVGGGWFGGWMAQQGRWREAFFILGATGLIYAVPYFFFLRTVRENSNANMVEQEAGGRPFLRVRSFLLLCAIFPVFVFGLWLIYSWLPNFLHEKYSLRLGDAAFNATAFLQGGTLVGMVSGGYLADRLFLRNAAARFWLLTSSLLVCAPCLCGLGWSATLDGTRVAATLFGLSAGVFMGNIFPAAFDVVSASRRSSAVGLLNFFAALVAGFAPLLGGIMKQTIGFEGLLYRTATAYVLAALILILGTSRWHRDDHARI